MSPLILRRVLGNIAWVALLERAPWLVDNAKELYESLRKRREEPEGQPLSATIEDVSSRLDELEDHQTRQAELLSRMAAQEEAISRGLRIVSTRLLAAALAALGAIILALIALVVAAVR